MIFLTWTLMKSEGIYWVQCVFILFIFIYSVMAWWIALAFNWATSLTEYFINGICVFFRSTFVLDDVWVFHINVYLFRLMVLILDKLSFAILSILFYRPILVLMINGKSIVVDMTTILLMPLSVIHLLNTHAITPPLHRFILVLILVNRLVCVVHEILRLIWIIQKLVLLIMFYVLLKWFEVLHRFLKYIISLFFVVVHIILSWWKRLLHSIIIKHPIIMIVLIRFWNNMMFHFYMFVILINILASIFTIIYYVIL